ncbi:MAG TPA: hypothetical protein VGF44_07790 [Terriglobales bacterium]
MTYLFDSRGYHVANLVGTQLHAPTGTNIGHYLEQQQIFIDMRGHYLGEIVFKNRLMYNKSSPHRSVNYGNYGNYGNAGNYGNPGNYGNIGTVARAISVPFALHYIENTVKRCPLLRSKLFCLRFQADSSPT